MRIAPETTPIERSVHRRQNLLIAVTFAGLLSVLALLNLTPLPAMVCEVFELDKDVPASMLGRAYWNDCFGSPLGTLAAGSLPRPEDLSYAPEADEFLASLENLAAQEEQIENVEAAQAEAEMPEPDAEAPEPDTEAPEPDAPAD